MPKRDREEGDDSNDEEGEGDVAVVSSGRLEGIPTMGDEGDPALYRQPPCITIADTQYTRYFVLDVRKEFRADQYVLRHHNDICILGLAESHYLLQPGASPIVQVSYSFGNRDRLKDVHHSGKRKRGSFLCNPDTLLCEIRTESGSTYRVISGVNGWLYELNERLLTQPQLIRQAPYADGFIAIVCPKDSKSLKALARHTPDTEYLARLAAGRASAQPPPATAPAAPPAAPHPTPPPATPGGDSTAGVSTPEEPAAEPAAPPAAPHPLASPDVAPPIPAPPPGDTDNAGDLNPCET